MINDYPQQLEAAIDLAKKAGQRQMIELYGPFNQEERKPDGTIVTAVDKMISEELTSSLRRYFPAYGLIDEEQDNSPESFLSAVEQEYCWVVDPLDNTRDYVEKRGMDYGTIIGLLHHSQPVLGVTYRPQLDELVYAVQGQGAYCTKGDGTRKIQVYTWPILHLLLSSHRGEAERQGIIERLQPSRVTFMGGALKSVEVAKGNATIWVNPPSARLSLWDICGTSVILQEAGGVITDYQGQPLSYRQRDFSEGIIASNGMVHGEVVRLLGKSSKS